jgi:hypothetical protein
MLVVTKPIAPSPLAVPVLFSLPAEKDAASVKASVRTCCIVTRNFSLRRLACRITFARLSGLPFRVIPMEPMLATSPINGMARSTRGRD